MRIRRTLGVLRPGGLEVGVREDVDGQERLCCIWIQALSKQQGVVGTFLNEAEVRRLIGWLERFARKT